MSVIGVLQPCIIHIHINLSGLGPSWSKVEFRVSHYLSVMTEPHFSSTGGREKIRKGG